MDGPVESTAGATRAAASTVTGVQPAEPGTRTVSLLADVVARFASAWEAPGDGTPPDLEYFLPGGLPVGDALRRAALVELIKVDLEYRLLRADRPRSLASYCEEFPELRSKPLPPDLLYEDFHLRRRGGHTVDVAEYAREFPEHADRLTDVLDGAGDYRSTLVAQPGAQHALDQVEVGDHIDDFDLLTGLGRGSFARVFLARQRSMQRLVAVKISHDHGTEPQTLAQLDHDYIVRVFDQRQLADRELKLLYMQYVPGGTLLDVLRRVREHPPGHPRTGRLLLESIDAVLERKGEIRPSDSSVRDELATLTWPETVAWLGRRLADALDYADQHGVLHRDIKPANVLLTSEGVPKLADFNISFSDRVAGTSPVAYFGGSLAYMSPEQLEACHPEMPGSAADLDARSDIYALGVMLWELLTGRRPFADESGAGESATSLERMLGLRRREIDPQFRDELPDDCPAALRRVLLTCLAPDPDGRWATGAELAQQFDLCLDARARDLVDPPPTSWRYRLRPWMIPIVALGAGVPNALAAMYNYHHNQTLIISELSAEAQQRFVEVSRVINSVLFPLGFVLIVYFCRYVISVPRGLRKGRTYDAATLARARADTLLMGDRIVAVVFALWLVAGIVFPVSLQIAAGSIPQGAYVHFLGSQIVCGAIAVAYPFFLVTFYAVRCLYPSLLPHGITSSSDERRLRGLDRRSTMYLAVAASVPLVGVAGVTFLSPDEISVVIYAVRVLCVGGVIAFVFVYWLFRLLEEDLRALERVVSQGTYPPYTLGSRVPM
ncbi:protein kinase [Rhodococcus hoagii]|uniref:non-specific serine/threonine protein kinase n=1 Tax=Rhodococcus hoagii TaxID=43767 RepID=A0AAE2W6X6_RHOHA|nr:serine/threonine-protein kinase [Prescottella equi]MBM4540819.1 protein kinase [Prescottella equi]MBM4714890.1 protein kinase [Prescottella equi]NKS11652.1 protein kinase [Prescottella equi]NKS25733.1 protein kinase [Prescottella equi]WJJ11149.1 serine/threonine-protein kinase [Prescottella equi]